MTISTTTNRVSYTGDGVSVAFTVPFLFLANSDISVYVAGAVVTTGFTTTGAGVGNGTVTFVTPPANGALVVLVRIPDFLQATSLPSNGPFPSDSVERMADKAMIGEQRLSDQVGRAIVLNDADAAATLTLPLLADRANKFLVFNASGLPTASAGTGTDTGLRADLAAAGGALLVAFRSAGTGAVLRTLYATLMDLPISVNNFGAVGDGTTDDTAAFNAAHVYASTVNRRVFVPGTAAGYKVSSITAKASMNGDGPNTVLSTSSATADVITIGAANITLRDFQVTASVTRTAGYHLNNPSYSGVKIENILFGAFLNGITLSGAGGVQTFHISRCNLTTSIASGNGILIQTTANSADVVLRDVAINGPSAGTQMASGVQITNVGDCLMSHVSTVKTGQGLLVQPGAGKVVQALFIDNCLFDSGSSTGINVNPQSTGQVQLLKAVNVWACTNVNGCTLSGNVLQSEWTNCTFSNNSTNGFAISATTVVNTKIKGGSMSSNVTGLSVVAAASGFSVEDVRIGTSGQFSVNTNGIVLGNGCDNFSIRGCDLRNNTSVATIGTLSGTPGQTFLIKDNLGLVTKARGQVSLTAAATSTTVTHGLAGTPSISDITISNDTGWGTAGQFFKSSPTSTQFTIGTASNPGAGVSVSWRAGIWGDF